MSEDEKDLICGQVIRQHKEAKKTLACVKEKGKKLGATLKHVSDVFVPRPNVIPQVSATVSGDRVSIHVGNEIYDLDWPSKDELIALLNEEKRLKEEIADLEQRLKELGYGDYAR